METYQILTVVLPGDDVTEKILSAQFKTKERGLQDMEEDEDESSSTIVVNNAKNTPKIGVGLSYDAVEKTVRATIAGRLFYRKSTNTYMILQNSKRYIPHVDDRILAIVEERIGDYYRMSVPGSTRGSALLHVCSFEGATKRNRPNLGIGALVYCRISVVAADREIEVTCLVGSSDGKGDDGGASRKDWMTNEGTYGELRGGTCFQVTLALARELLNPRNVVLDALASMGKMPFELCIGVNGFIWIHSVSQSYTVLIVNAIRNSQVMTEEQTRSMVKQLVTTLNKTRMQE